MKIEKKKKKLQMIAVTWFNYNFLAHEQIWYLLFSCITSYCNMASWHLHDFGVSTHLGLLFELGLFLLYLFLFIFNNILLCCQLFKFACDLSVFYYPSHVHNCFHIYLLHLLVSIGASPYLYFFGTFKIGWFVKWQLLQCWLLYAWFKVFFSWFIGFLWYI